MHSEGDPRHPRGAIHGRFQPFHNGHMEYRNGRSIDASK
jgi:hypothetical protein